MSEKEIVLVTGGSRSGKSNYVVSRAKHMKRPVLFIATAQALDEEMRRRIGRHQRSRPRRWRLREEPYALTDALRQATAADVLIIDCVTLWVSNLLLRGDTDRLIVRQVRECARALAACPATVLIVSNEVGCGIVPEHKLARRFRDIAGTVNQLLAAVSTQVVLCVAGIPHRIK